MTKETILVIDDDLDLRESLVEILTEKGFQAVGRDSAESGLKAAKVLSPKVIIIDNMMPGMGGMACIPLLKREIPSAKILMITAFSTVDNAVMAMKSGADDYIAKPFKKDELLTAVYRSLEELKFARRLSNSDLDGTLACLSNLIRRQILTALKDRGEMRFMDITRYLNIADHTKVNFHLKNLKNKDLIQQNREKVYSLTQHGIKMLDCLSLLSKQLSD